MQLSAINILGVAGSMRADSYSTKALKTALDLVKKYGAEVRLLDLSKTVLPLHDPGAPASGQVEEEKEAARAVEWADAFILASPDYHGSMSGALKNFLDHFHREFGGKLFGYVVASHEKGLTAMDQMRTVMRQCYGWSMPYGVSVNGEQDFANGRLVNAEVSKRLEMMARDLVAYSRLIREQFVRDLESSEPYTFAARYRALLKPA
ncbi:MAG: NADPH-dependent FMN reductase [Thermoproteota archaeon]